MLIVAVPTEEQVAGAIEIVGSGGVINCGSTIKASELEDAHAPILLVTV